MPTLEPHTTAVTGDYGFRADYVAQMNHMRSPQAHNSDSTDSINLSQHSLRKDADGRDRVAYPDSKEDVRANYDRLDKELAQQHRRRITYYMSPSQFHYLYLGAARTSDAVHPLAMEKTDLLNGTRDDEYALRVVVSYPDPPKGEIHPDAPSISDGRLHMVYKAQHVHDAKAIDTQEGRIMDFLLGNRSAIDQSSFRRIFGSIYYRFHSYFRGMKEGISGPRQNGSISSNLVITSVAISALLYATFYALDYGVTEHGMAHPKHHPAPPPSPGVNNNGSTYSIG